MASNPISVRILPGCRGAISAPELRRVARAVFHAEGVQRQVEVTLALADADTVHELNRLHRGHDEPTDVLSYGVTPAEPEWAADAGAPENEVDPRPSTIALVEPPAFIDAPGAAPYLGDVVVCLPLARDQAVVARGSVAGSVAHLAVHGLLHLLAYDHEEAAGSAAMQSREDELLSALGYAGQYAHGHLD